jgi:hypothetical protein
MFVQCDASGMITNSLCGSRACHFGMILRILPRLSSDPCRSSSGIVTLFEGETHGINIRELELACTDGSVQARVWDFGGQHVLHAMHEFFLTARSFYLLVLGERDDMAERDATYWLQLIRSYAGPAPVVVALNKSGGRAREMDRRTLEEKCGPILTWVPTECSESDPTKSGIEALSDALTKATDGMEEVRRLFPTKWFEIKNGSTEWRTLTSITTPTLSAALS